MDLTVSLTADKYARYKAAFKKLHQMEDDPTDEQLVAQLKREAAAITYAAETKPGEDEGWKF